MKSFISNPEEVAMYTNWVMDAYKKGHLKVSRVISCARWLINKTIIHKEFPFTAEDVAQAQKDISGGKTIGKLVIRVS